MARAVGKFPTRAVFPALTAFSFQSAIISARTAECMETNNHPPRNIHAILPMVFPLIKRFEIPATMAQRLCQPRTGTQAGIPQANSKANTARGKRRKEINLKRSVQTDTEEYKKRQTRPVGKVNQSIHECATRHNR